MNNFVEMTIRKEQKVPYWHSRIVLMNLVKGSELLIMSKQNIKLSLSFISI